MKITQFIKSMLSIALLSGVYFTQSVYAQNSQYQPSIDKTMEEPLAVKNNSAKHQIKFKAHKDYSFLLSADYRYFPSKATARYMPGVIILHDCESTRNQYETLSIAVAELGLHTLSLDLRGYGNSINSAYSYKKIKQEADSIVDFQSDKARLMSYWSSDLMSAYKLLRTKVDKSQGISVVSSGCSSPFAVGLAEQVYVKSLVLLTPEMSYGDKERYKNLVDIPSYFISSAQHATSFSSAQELFSWNGDKKSKMLIYKGDKVNHSIIKAKVHLVHDIALWIKTTLR